MNQMEIGKFIQTRRKEKGFTQKMLAEKLNVSYQAVSKWENGETLPDTALLIDLSNILGTSVDLILRGGTYLFNNRKLLLISDILKGFESIKNIKKYFGENSLFYVGMIEGINSKMNMDLESALNNNLEVLVAEVILQSLTMSNYIVDLDEVNSYFTNKKLRTIIIDKVNQVLE